MPSSLTVPVIRVSLVLRSTLACRTGVSRSSSPHPGGSARVLARTPGGGQPGGGLSLKASPRRPDDPEPRVAVPLDLLHEVDLPGEIFLHRRLAAAAAV